ncbi:MAG: tRNA-specific adenosine deaminase [Legionellaceae bacterium]
MNNEEHEFWIRHALKLAQRASDEGEVPIGAVLVQQGKLIAEGWNQPIQYHDPSAHAEIMVLRKAGEFINNYRLIDTTLYVTLEPCVMCAGAIIQARIKNLIFGAFDLKAGAVDSVFNLLNSSKLNHQVPYQGGVLAQDCLKLMQDFFKSRRKNQKS